MSPRGRQGKDPDAEKLAQELRDQRLRQEQEAHQEEAARQAFADRQQRQQGDR